MHAESPLNPYRLHHNLATHRNAPGISCYTRDWDSPIIHETTSPCRRSRRRNHGLAHRRPLRQCRNSGRSCSISFSPTSRSAMPPRWRASRPPRSRSPARFFTAAAAALITPGNFDDDLGRPRRLRLDHRSRHRESRDQARAAAKRGRACARPAPSSPPTPAAFRWRSISEGFAPSSAQHFLGTHFFNPPRYLHLVEMIPGPDTAARSPATSSPTSAIVHLGKGVVPLQGHAELHRQSHRQLLRRHRPQAHRRRTITPSKKWTRSPAR